MMRNILFKLIYEQILQSIPKVLYRMHREYMEFQSIEITAHRYIRLNSWTRIEFLDLEGGQGAYSRLCAY